MELKDNFTKQYFNNYIDSVKNTKDLINQSTAADAIGEGFEKLGSQKAEGPSQRMSNAVMTGLGSGIKAAANSERQEKLSPLLEQAGKINAQAAMLEAQNQQMNQQRMTMVNFIRENAGSLQDLGKASMADNPAAQKIAKHLADNLQRSMGVQFGEFDHYDPQSRKIFFNQGNGSIIGYSVLDAVRPFATEALGEQANFMTRDLDPYHQEVFQNAEELRQLGIEKERAGIDQTKAHTGLYDAQAGKAVQEANNPPISKEQELQQKLDSDIKKDRAAKNYTTIEDKIIPRMQANENILSVYENLDNILLENPSIVGSDLKARARRSLATTFGFEEDLDYTKLKSLEFEKMLKPILGAQLGEKEGERLLSKFASVDNNPKALKNFLDNEIPKTARSIVKDKSAVELYDSENHANLFTPSLDENLDNNTQSFLDKRRQKGKSVTMVAPDGSKRQVPADQVAKWEQKGASIVNE